MNVEIVLFEGFDELDAIGPFEVFANAGRTGADCDVSLVSLDGGSHIRASHGLRVETDAELGATAPDLVVVPGGGWNDTDGPGARTAAETGRLPRALADLHEGGVRLAAVCTGGMLLAEAGVLDGRPATTHHSALDELKADADVRQVRVVDLGDVVTSGGVTSGLDMAFHVVANAFGERVATDVAAQMEYEPSDDVLVV